MTYTYTWTDAEQTGLLREDENGNTAFVPAAEGNRHYAAYLASGETASPYVAPAAAPEPTDAEKLERATGLTVAEIKAVLGLY